MPGSFDDTSRATALNNTLASSRNQRDHLNEQLRNLYLARFNSWVEGVNAGKTDNANPPKPPMGYRISEASADPYGFQWPELGTEPVCDIPPVPEDRTKPQAAPETDGDTKRNVGPEDKQPVGHVVTDPDGSKWKKVSSKTPFGTSVYYEKQ